MYILDNKDCRHAIQSIWLGECLAERIQISGFVERVILEGKKGIGKTIILLSSCSKDKRGLYIAMRGHDNDDFLTTLARYFAIPFKSYSFVLEQLEEKLKDRVLYIDDGDQLLLDPLFVSFAKKLRQLYIAVSENGDELAKKLDARLIKIDALGLDEFNDLAKCLSSARGEILSDEEIRSIYEYYKERPFSLKLWLLLPKEERKNNLTLLEMLDILLKDKDEKTREKVNMLLNSLYPIPIDVIGYASLLSFFTMEVNDRLEDLSVKSSIQIDDIAAKEYRDKLAEKLAEAGYTILAALHYTDDEKIKEVLSKDLSCWLFLPAKLAKRMDSTTECRSWKDVFREIALYMNILTDESYKKKIKIETAEYDMLGWLISYLLHISTRGEYIGKRISVALDKLEIEGDNKVTDMFKFLKAFIDGTSRIDGSSVLLSVYNTILKVNALYKSGKKIENVSLLQDALDKLGTLFAKDSFVASVPTLVAGLELAIAYLLEKNSIFELAQDVRELLSTHLSHLVDINPKSTEHFILWAWNEIGQANNMLSMFKRPEAKVLLEEIMNEVERHSFTGWSIEGRWISSMIEQLLAKIIITRRDELDSVTHGQHATRNYKRLIAMTFDNVFLLYLGANYVWEISSEISLRSKSVDAINIAVKYRAHDENISNQIIENVVRTYISENVNDEYDLPAAADWLARVLQDVPPEIATNIILLAADELLLAMAGMTERVLFPRANLAQVIYSIMPTLVRGNVNPAVIIEALKILAREAVGRDKLQTIAILCVCLLMSIREGHDELIQEFKKAVEVKEIPVSLRREITRAFDEEINTRNFAKTISLIQRIVGYTTEK